MSNVTFDKGVAVSHDLLDKTMFFFSFHILILSFHEQNTGIIKISINSIYIYICMSVDFFYILIYMHMSTCKVITMIHSAWRLKIKCFNLSKLVGCSHLARAREEMQFTDVLS